MNGKNQNRIRKLGNGFTLIELLVVISIIAVLASMVIGLSGLASRKMKEARVKGELNQLLTAIEDYRSEHNTYPPDNAKTGADFDPRLTPLYYELTGAVFTNNQFVTVNSQEVVAPAALESRFGVKGIVNSARDPRDVKTFVNFKPAQFKELKPLAGEDVEVLVVPAKGPAGGPPGAQPILDKDNRPLNTWRYDASSTNRHNRQTFDLWAEILVGRQTNIIGNWKQ